MITPSQADEQFFGSETLRKSAFNLTRSNDLFSLLDFRVTALTTYLIEQVSPTNTELATEVLRQINNTKEFKDLIRLMADKYREDHGMKEAVA